MIWFKTAGIILAGGLFYISGAAFKIVGYVPDWAGAPSYVQWDKVTHLNYAFVLPTDCCGSIAKPDSGILTYLVTQGHSRRVKILVSIGGWNNGDDKNFHSVAASKTATAAFVTNCMNMVNKFNLDGIDIDWEYPDAGVSADQYVTFMTGLATALHAKGKLLTAAVIGTAGAGIKNEVFPLVDFLNIMSYDHGTPHSPYSTACSDLKSWRTRGLAKEKAVLGVPFYGRDPFTSYVGLTKLDFQAPFKDRVGDIYYNGIATMQKKAQLAIDTGGGVMMWDLSLDVSGDYSLHKAIWDLAGPVAGIAPNPEQPGVLDPLRKTLPGLPGIFHRNTIFHLHLARPMDVRIDVVDMHGRVAWVIAEVEKMQAGMHAMQWNGGPAIGSGPYVFRLTLKQEAAEQVIVRPIMVLQ